MKIKQQPEMKIKKQNKKLHLHLPITAFSISAGGSKKIKLHLKINEIKGIDLRNVETSTE